MNKFYINKTGDPDSLLALKIPARIRQEIDFYLLLMGTNNNQSHGIKSRFRTHIELQRYEK